MKKKQIRNVIILVCILAVLILGVVLYRVISEKVEADRSAREAEEAEAATIYLDQLSDVAEVSFNGLDFTYDSESDSWYYTEDAEFPIDDTDIVSIVKCFSGMTAVRSLSDGDTMENYGLADPAYTITLSSAAGAEETFAVGNATGSYYYVMVNGNTDTIYTATVSVLSKFSDDVYDYALIEDIASVWYGSETAITVESAEGETFTAVETTLVIDESETSEDETSSDSEEEEEDPLADTAELLNLDYEGLVAYNVPEDELSKYGLDEPAYTVTITYTDDADEEQQLVLYFGTVLNLSETYVTAASSESDEIYWIDAAVLDDLAGLFE